MFIHLVAYLTPPDYSFYLHWTHVLLIMDSARGSMPKTT